MRPGRSIRPDAISSGLLVQGTPGISCFGRLEDSAKLEEPFLVAGVADAAADEDRAKERFGENAAGGVARKLGGGEGIAVYFANFGKASEVALFTDELGKSENFVKIAGAAD